ncbi:MAG: hypothetical protein AAFR57_07220, partial [Pseudomonadota bacterium]
MITPDLLALLASRPTAQKAASDTAPHPSENAFAEVLADAQEGDAQMIELPDVEVMANPDVSSQTREPVEMATARLADSQTSHAAVSSSPTVESGTEAHLIFTSAANPAVETSPPPAPAALQLETDGPAQFAGPSIAATVGSPSTALPTDDVGEIAPHVETKAAHATSPPAGAPLVQAAPVVVPQN